MTFTLATGSPVRASTTRPWRVTSRCCSEDCPCERMGGEMIRVFAEASLSLSRQRARKRITSTAFMAALCARCSSIASRDAMLQFTYANIDCPKCGAPVTYAANTLVDSPRALILTNFSDQIAKVAEYGWKFPGSRLTFFCRRPSIQLRQL